MKTCTDFVVEKLRSLEDIPTIITWDFNIYKESYSIQSIIKNWYQHINNTHHTTLNPDTHPGFQNNIPSEWFMVDHVFMKWIQVLEYHIPMVTVSDHLPIEYRCEI
jgi:endonuclease/exonuclease/phosphatase family metal-dependent hydrolase